MLMEAMGVVHDGYAVQSDHAILARLGKQVENQFVMQKTRDTAAVVDKITKAHKRAQEYHDNVRRNPAKYFPVALVRLAKESLNEAKAAFAPVAPVCAQYERINFFNRKCKHCQRKKSVCEASAPAKERLDKAQARYNKVSLSAEHFVYVLVIYFCRYYLVMCCKSGGR